MHRTVERRHLVSILWILAVILVGCATEPQIVAVTRIVNQEIPVPVEVTQEVAQPTTVPAPAEVTVEVTRLVEVVLTPTPLPTEEQVSPGEEAQPSPIAEPTRSSAAVNQPASSNIYTVEAGDTLFRIAAKTGVTVDEIVAANNLTSDGFIAVDQQLVIPGWNGEIVSTVVAPTPTPPPSPEPETPPQPAAPAGANLLPNPSFEGDWYFFNGVPEWQIAEGWSLAIDEGPNTLTPEEDDVFLRPEVRVVSKADLPPRERGLFVFDGQKTVKIFKGGAPTHFAVFTDIALAAGAYRFTINFFPDTVSSYNGGQKVWATDPLAAEVRFIQNGGGSDWVTVAPGQKNTLTYDFSLGEPATVRLGADFRNRYVNSNNGWFLDGWSLQALDAP